MTDESLPLSVRVHVELSRAMLTTSRLGAFDVLRVYCLFESPCATFADPTWDIVSGRWVHDGRPASRCSVWLPDAFSAGDTLHAIVTDRSALVLNVIKTVTGSEP